MDESKSLSYSMIFEVLAALSAGPMTITQLSYACKVQQVYLRAVVSSAIASGLVRQNADNNAFLLTKKGIRTAIYILVINDGLNYSKGDYRALMNALDRALESEAQA